MTRIVSNTGQYIQNLAPWVQSNIYNAGDECIFLGAIYKANSYIAANTPFVPGTTGATWTQVYQGAGTGSSIVQVTINGMNSVFYRFSNGEVYGATGGNSATPQAFSGIGLWQNNPVGSDSGLQQATKIIFFDRVINFTETGTCTSISTQGGSAYALFSNGNLWGWGYNGEGQLGLGNTTYQGLPRLIQTSVSQVYTHPSGVDRGDQAFHRTVIRKTDNKIYACGFNLYGALGLGTTTNSVTSFVELPWCGVNPRSVWNLGAINGCIIANRVVAAGAWGVWGAGFNANGCMGDPGNTGVITTAKALNWTFNGTTQTIVDVAGGFGYDAVDNTSTIAMWLTGNVVKTCGAGTWGALGNGSTTAISTPVTITLIGTIKQISGTGGGPMTVFVLMTNGNLWGWGRNEEGQLGDGSTTNRPSPQLVGTLGGVKEILVPHSRPYINAYQSTAYFRNTDGGYYSTGSNAYGGQGVGLVGGASSTTRAYSRMRIPATTNWAAFGGLVTYIGAAYVPVMVDTDNNIWAWGNNTDTRPFSRISNDTVPSPVRINPNYL